MKTIIIITTFLYFLFFSFLGLSASAHANSVNEEQDIDQLALASLLIKNKNFSRAHNVLESIKDPNDVIPEKLFALRGILHIKKNEFSDALDDLKLASQYGLKSADLYEAYARCYVGLNKFDLSLEILEKHKKSLSSNVSYYQLLSTSYFGLKKPELAWQSLNKGIELFPNNLPIHKQKWFYLMENKLYEVSFEVAKNLVDNYEINALDLARMGLLYRNANELDKAITFGELARLKDMQDEEIAKDLARSYIAKDMIMASAQIFSELGLSHPKYLSEASSLWRRAGHLMHAKNLILDIRDPVEKMKQSLTQALVTQDFNQMVSMAESIQRSSLRTDEDIQYALAYAQFMNGNYGRAYEHLKYIQRSDLFKKAIALRQAITDCESGDSICF